MCDFSSFSYSGRRIMMKISYKNFPSLVINGIFSAIHKRENGCVGGCEISGDDGEVKWNGKG